MIYKALYDKLKACSIDDNSDNDIVLRLNTQYTTIRVFEQDLFS